MNSFNCIYPNPFRYAKVKKTLNYEKILKEVYQSIKPFLKDNFSDIHNQIDELGNPKSEKRLKKIFQTTISDTSNFIKDKAFFFSKQRFLSSNNFDNYYDNLRYLELPVQSIVDKHGFELQVLSNELIDDVIEEIDEGISYVYNYLPNYLPDCIENWSDYAILNPTQFPYVSHDKLLEYNYEIVDRIFDDIQKNSTTLFNSLTTGDINTRIIQIITPSLKKTKLNYILICTKSLFGVALLLLIINYITLNYSGSFDLNKKELLVNNLINNLINIRKQFILKTFRFQQKTKKLKIKLINLKIQSKYIITKFMLGTTKSVS